MCDVNVTSLIDVLFVLLIALMISASSVARSSIKISLPKAETSEKAQEAEVDILITPRGEVYVGKTIVPLAELQSHLSHIAKDKNTSKVVIRSDGDTDYGIVMQVMDQSRIAGLVSVSLVVDDGNRKGKEGRPEEPAREEKK